mmetsp:Transcript_10235/g.32466  ORF Transcript_10235/g.32466 Transcript_10235/m.32466 type:complete len:96 (+) Transcript_10235:97-384(+)
MPYATFYFGVANTGEITTNLTIGEDISGAMAKIIENPMKQTSFSLSKGDFFTHKWWVASNVRNYAVITPVLDQLEQLGYSVISADKDYIILHKKA